MRNPQKKRLLRVLPALAFLLILAWASAACADEAADITARCTLKPGSVRKKIRACTDRDYTTYWSSNSGKGAVIEVELPKGETASGVWLQWYEHPHAWSLQLPEGDGWTEIAATEGAFLSEYLPLPEGTDRFRIANPAGSSRRFMLAELRIYGAGETPRDIQRWEPPAEKADLLLVAAHPDDEVLWFGGTLPTYAGERGKTCQVGMLVPSTPHRRLELLDCLWTCGLTRYPVWGKFPDSFSGTLKAQYTRWSKNRVYQLVTEWIRRFRPEVLLTHDFAGEYGHGAHRVCADAVAHCLTLAADKKKYPESFRVYGVWDVPKCYIHLYAENRIEMDWRLPLDAFGGRTSFEMAEEAFRCHRSQQHTDYRVLDSGPCDCRLFGLYRSLVGPDEAGNDFFEHLD